MIIYWQAIAARVNMEAVTAMETTMARDTLDTERGTGRTTMETVTARLATTVVQAAMDMDLRHMGRAVRTAPLLTLIREHICR